jgi:hypothetical protein
MNILLSLLLLILGPMPENTIFDFNKNSNISSWSVVDDVVMGGRSSGNFGLSEEGHGVFSGEVSLENNGGFSSVRYSFNKLKVNTEMKVVLKIKGDGKDYQFRVKHNANDAHSYITTFQTSGDWETIEIPLKDLYPSFRGRTLDMPNFNHNSMEQIAFLIANKKPENFKLLIDKIDLK